MEERFITNKICIDWAVTRGNFLSYEGEKQDPFLAPLHTHSHTLVFGVAGAWVGHAQLPQTLPACGLSFEHIFLCERGHFLCLLYPVPGTETYTTKPLGTASSQLCSQGT